jgi:1-acyl-sn-glycerol-3-phosphate acyltransferase
MTADPAGDRKRWFADGFRDVYLPRYLRKRVHAVRLARGSASVPESGPYLVAMNHPGWFDPLTAVWLTRRFPPAVEHFGAIDRDALTVYRFFRWLGMVGVDTKSVRGAAEFLRTATTLLAKPDRAFWITAQGAFADVRKRPLNLRSGVGHLAARMAGGWVLPVAVEYPFWAERTPEVLIRVGDPLPAGGGTGRDWTRRVEESLTATMDALAIDSLSRDEGRFETLLGGSAGAGGVFDLWRRAKSAVTGRRFVAGHAAAVREAGR